MTHPDDDRPQQQHDPPRSERDWRPGQAGAPPRQDQIRPTTGLEPSQSGRPRDEGPDAIGRTGEQHPRPDSPAETPSEADLQDRETM
jgi:hypothetical protein